MANMPAPPITILNVDDQEISRYTKSRVLRQAGFEVKEASSGYETLELLQREHPSLVLLDVGLPDINGLEVCRRIKSNPELALTPVLQISTSHLSGSDKIPGLEGGADAYLVEPVEPTELVATVRALLRLRQAEFDLEAQHAFLRQVIDLNPSLIFVKDRQGRFTLVNQAVADVYGTNLENLIGKTDADFSANPAEIEHFRRDDLEVMNSLQEKFIPEETITDAAGQTRWLQTVKRPIIGPDGLSHQILGVATDITLRKQAQAALTQLNETLEQRVYERTALIQLLQEIAAAANEAETVEEALQFALDRVCAYTGWPVGHVYWLNRENLAELISSSLWHLDQPERYEAFRQASESTRLPSGVGLPGQVWANGQVTWLTDVTHEANFPRAAQAAEAGLRAGFGFPLWVGQEIVAVLEFYSPETVEPEGAFLEAITQIGTQLGRVVERRRADRRIRESEQQLLEAQQIAHLGSWQWDIAANQVSWSDELYRIYGLPPQSTEINYEGFLARVHPEDRDRVAALVSAAFESGQPFDFEHRVVRPDGTIRTLHAQGKVMLDERGRPFKMVGTGHDITEREAMEEQLRRLNSELEQRVAERTAQLEAANQELAEEISERKRAELASRFLAEAGQVLTHSLDPATQLSNIARLAVPNLADWCAVDLYEEDWTVHHVAAAHVDPAKVSLAQEVQRRYPPRREELLKGDQPWQKGQSQLYPEITEAMLEAGAQDAEHYEILRSLNLRSAMVVPLVARERVLGIMAFFWAESNRRYDEEDLALAEELARRAAIALDNAQAYAAEQKARQEAEANAARIASLQDITAAFSEALTSAEVARVVIEHALPVLDATGGVVMLLDADGATLETVDYIGYPPEAIEPWRRYPVTAAGPAPEAVRTGQAIFVESPQEFKARYGRLPSQIRSDFRAWAAAPLVVKGRTLGAIGLSFTEPQAFTLQDRAFLLALAQQCAQALERARLYEVEQQARAEAEANQQRLALLAEMRERNRLAQELHDTVAQALGYLNLKLGITESLLADEKIEAAQANFRELKQVIGETYTDVREEIFNLRAKVLSGLGFMEVLNRYVDKYRRFYNLDIQLIHEVDPSVLDFTPETTSQLVRTIQEALINIRKHAQVNQAVIRLGEENGQIRISIEDEGRGFDPAKIKEKTASFGLQIMRERVESVGGTLEINTVPGQGTQVILRYQK